MNRRSFFSGVAAAVVAVPAMLLLPKVESHTLSVSLSDADIARLEELGRDQARMLSEYAEAVAKQQIENEQNTRKIVRVIDGIMSPNEARSLVNLPPLS